MHSDQWKHHGLTLEGLSLAGVRTSIAVPEHLICFDVAQGLPYALSMQTFLISHGHMDHAAGIPYIISQKAMNSHKPARFIMPFEMVAPMKEIMHQWSIIEGHQYDFEFVGAFKDQEFPLKSQLFIRPFQTFHRIPSLGYSLCRRYRKLKHEYENMPSEKIRDMKKENHDPTEEKVDILISFTGDTKIEFLDANPEVSASKILILEATYLDEKKTVESARAWGHTHLDEIIPRLSSLSSEKIVLIHSSARYSYQEAMTMIKRKVPSHEHERIILFPGR